MWIVQYNFWDSSIAEDIIKFETLSENTVIIPAITNKLMPLINSVIGIVSQTPEEYKKLFGNPVNSSNTIYVTIFKTNGKTSFCESQKLYDSDNKLTIDFKDIIGIYKVDKTTNLIKK